MHYFNRYTIKVRLLAIVCLAITFYIGFSTYAIYGTKQINNAVNTIYEYQLTIANDAAAAQLRATELKELLQHAYINRDQDYIRSIESKAKDIETKILINLDAVKDKMLTDEGKGLANEAITLSKEWRNTQERAIDMLLKNDREGIQAYFQSDGLLDDDRFIKKLDEINVYANKRASLFQQEANQKQDSLVTVLTVLAALFAAMLLVMFFLTTRSIQSGIQKLKNAMADCTTNHQFVSVELDGQNELVDMANDYNKLIHILKDQFLLKDGQTRLNDHISGNMNVHDLANKIICFLADYTHAGQGAFYLYHSQEKMLKLISSYAYTEREHGSNRFALGEGIVGQVGLEKKPILLKNIKRSEGLITTGIVSEAPFNTFTFPLVHENHLYGVIELASFEPFNQVMQEFLLEAGKTGTINLLTAIQSERMKELLEDAQKSNALLEEQREMLEQQAQNITAQNDQLKELLESSQKQAEELQVQQEELRMANEELEQQTEALKMSEEKLQAQQEELKVTNEELEERAKILVKQNDSIVEKNRLLVQAQHEIQVKAEQLEYTSKYKSEFLANMSHELRTPLNSILVLSQMLTEKKDNSPLTEKQLQFAHTIHEAGVDLMKLINDILDLSKMEAGRLQITAESIRLLEFTQSMQNQFAEIAALKDLELDIQIHPDMPEAIVNDQQRLSQIIKNLMSNALKFTEEGGVTLTIRRALPEEVIGINLNPDSAVSFSVRDTGIGIPEEKHSLIFEAFQQVDGTISRKYGGTGLGLSISRELAKNLNGHILMNSGVGKGSSFTLVIPEQLSLACDPVELSIQEAAATVEQKVQFETNDKTPSTRSLLIIHQHPVCIDVLSHLASAKQFEYFLAHDGETGLKLAYELHPTAIVINKSLPDMNGWDLLKKLRANPHTAEIPVHVITGMDQQPLQPESHDRMLAEAALFLHGIPSYGPKDQIEAMKTQKGNELILRGKKILLIDDDMRNIFAISSLLEEKGIQIIEAKNGREGIGKLLQNQDTDLVLMDIMMPDMDGYTAMREIRNHQKLKQVPIIALTAKAMRDDRDKCIDAGANDYLTKPVDNTKLLSLLRVWLYQ